MKIIHSGEKKKILEKLKEQFGIENLPYLLIKFGKEKIRIYSGNLSIKELQELDNTIRIETIGVYAFHIHPDGIRISFDAVEILKDQITKNIIELTKEEADQWMKGLDLEIKSKKGFVVLKYKDKFLGCGKSTTEKITNFVPKERRIK